MDGEERGDLGIAIHSRPEGTAEAWQQPDRRGAEQPRRLVVPVRDIESGACREDPDRAAVVPDAEADGALLAEDHATLAAAIGDPRPIVDAGSALEQGDKRELDGVD